MVGDATTVGVRTTIGACTGAVTRGDNAVGRRTNDEGAGTGTAFLNGVAVGGGRRETGDNVVDDCVCSGAVVGFALCTLLRDGGNVIVRVDGDGIVGLVEESGAFVGICNDIVVDGLLVLVEGKDNTTGGAGIEVDIDIDVCGELVEVTPLTVGAGLCCWSLLSFLSVFPSIGSS